MTWKPVNRGVMLYCDVEECSSFRYAPNKTVVSDRARTAGWHLFDGTNQAGAPMSSHLCPQHIGMRKRPDKVTPEPLPEDQQLF